MGETMWAKRIEVAANIAVLVAAVSIVAFTIAPRLRKSPVLPGRYEVGDRIRETDQLTFGAPTLILNTASSCTYCTASMEFYARLQELGVRTIAVTPEPSDVNARYLASHGIKPLAVLSASANGLTFSGTPALLLVDGRGVVNGAWMGRQTADGEAEIIRALK